MQLAVGSLGRKNESKRDRSLDQVLGRRRKCGAEGAAIRTPEEGARGYITRDATQIIKSTYTQAAHLNPITVLCDSAIVATLRGANREYTHEL